MESKKKCNKCKNHLAYDKFYKDSRNKTDGLRSRCKRCVNEDSMEYAKRNKENTTKIRNRYRAKNKERLRQSRLDKYRGNLEESREFYRNAMRKRRENPVERFKLSIKSEIRDTLTKRRPSLENSRLYRITGLTGPELINYLHSTFEENYGIPRAWIDLKEVEIDHIIPISTAKTKEEVKKLNHYTNLQLLFKEDNQSKGTKLLTDPSDICGKCYSSPAEEEAALEKWRREKGE